jgi:hypothetical protein
VAKSTGAQRWWRKRQAAMPLHEWQEAQEDDQQLDGIPQRDTVVRWTKYIVITLQFSYILITKYFYNL